MTVTPEATVPATGDGTLMMYDFATRFEPKAAVKGRALAVTGLVAVLAAVPAAFAPSLLGPAVVLGGLGLLVSAVALVRAIGGRRAGRNIALAGVILGVFACGSVVVTQATYAPAPKLRVAGDRPISAVGPRLQGVNVKIGRYARSGVPVTVTNTGVRARSMDLTVEAVSPKGRRISTDTVSASRVAPGKSSTSSAFRAQDSALAAQLRTATFRLIETTSFSG